MPRETIALIRAAMAWLAASCAMMTAVALEPRWSAVLRPALVHTLTLGWLSQFIFGVAHWLFPKNLQHPPRGDLRRVWWLAGFWNAGLVLRLAAEPRLMAGAADIATRMAMSLSAAFLLAGSVVFVVHMWPRVRGA